MNRVLLCWFIGGAVAAQGQTNLPGLLDSRPAPRIGFGSTIFDFGRMKSGEIAKHDFVFTNSGDATLEVLEVKPGCGCTTTGDWDRKIEPGKTGKVPLAFNSTGFSGQVGKSATVICNDPVRSNLVLQITGTVWKAIEITPAMAMFMPSNESGASETKVLHIVNNLNEPLRLSELRSSSDAFKTELTEVKPGRQFDLRVTVAPPFASPTLFSTITFKTSSPSMPLVSISAYAIVQQVVMVTPQRLVLPAGPLKAPYTTAVMIRNNSTNTLALSEVHLDVPGAQIRLSEPQTGRVYSISMTFPAGLQLQPGEKNELTFRSNHATHPLIKVPVVQAQPATTTPASGPATGRLRPASPLQPTSSVGPATLQPSAGPGH